MDEIRNYYVDESGTGLLFNRRGKVLLGSEGVSNFFMLGALYVRYPEQLREELSSLREEILKDPYFASVPSCQVENRKTALLFHAKDDVPEVRREVMRILLQADLKFVAVIKDMRVVLRYVQARNSVDPDYRYHPNELYDLTVRMIFKNLLHKSSFVRIAFSKRGNSERTGALHDAIQTSRVKFEEQTGIQSNTTIAIQPKESRQDPCLQAVDYFLWSLQRLYEKGEERYISYLREKISLVHDVDDRSLKEYGVYYTRRNRITAEAIKNRRV
ncbi:DUF3800 domain-containing protein [bacterium]|nr:DUF3800 domain-containing protein [bacterium]